MTTDITPKNVARMLEGVTPGPWWVVEDRSTWGWVEVDGPSIKIASPTAATDLTDLDAQTRRAEARFIAWAREAVPAISAKLAEVEAERNHIAEGAAYDRAMAEAAEARAATLVQQ